MADKKSGKKNTAGKVTLVCGIIALVFSAAFILLGLLGVEPFQEEGSSFQNVFGIIMGVFLIYRGKSMLNHDD